MPYHPRVRRSERLWKKSPTDRQSMTMTMLSNSYFLDLSVGDPIRTAKRLTKDSLFVNFFASKQMSLRIPGWIDPVKNTTAPRPDGCCTLPFLGQWKCRQNLRETKSRRIPKQMIKKAEPLFTRSSHTRAPAALRVLYTNCSAQPAQLHESESGRELYQYIYSCPDVKRTTRSRSFRCQTVFQRHQIILVILWNMISISQLKTPSLSRIQW